MKLNTVGQKWRFRRDLLIAHAIRCGFSQRFVADVFDLPRSRVHAICKEMKAKARDLDDRAGSSKPPTFLPVPKRRARQVLHS